MPVSDLAAVGTAAKIEGYLAAVARSCNEQIIVARWNCEGQRRRLRQLRYANSGCRRRQFLSEQFGCSLRAHAASTRRLHTIVFITCYVLVCLVIALEE